MKFVFVFLFAALLVPNVGRAAIHPNRWVQLPQGQRELADLAMPEEIEREWGSAQQIPVLPELHSMTEQDRDAYKVYIYVSKAQQHLWVYLDGVIWDHWYVSTGTEQMRCPSPPQACRIAHTPTGRRHPGALDWEHYSSIYDNAAMHRAIQFAGGIYLHATYGEHIEMLGQRDSAGCVRQHPDDAEKLFLLVKDIVNRYGRQAVMIEISED